MCLVLIFCCCLIIVCCICDWRFVSLCCMVYFFNLRLFRLVIVFVLFNFFCVLMVSVFVVCVVFLVLSLVDLFWVFWECNLVVSFRVCVVSSVDSVVVFDAAIFSLAFLFVVIWVVIMVFLIVCLVCYVDFFKSDLFVWNLVDGMIFLMFNDDVINFKSLRGNACCICGK